MWYPGKITNIVTCVWRHIVRHKNMRCLHEPALKLDLNNHLPPSLSTHQTEMDRETKRVGEWGDVNRGINESQTWCRSNLMLLSPQTTDEWVEHSTGVEASLIENRTKLALANFQKMTPTTYMFSITIDKQSSLFLNLKALLPFSNRSIEKHYSGKDSLQGHLPSGTCSL